MKTSGLILAIVWAVASQAAAFPEPETLWDYECGAEIVGTPVFYPSVAAPTHVLALTQAGHLVCVDPKGQRAWDLDLGARADASPAVGDIDGDKVPEIVTATLTGELIVADAGGQERWRYPLHGKVSDWGGPCLPDIDGDGVREIVVGDQGGWLNCLSGEGKRLWQLTLDAYQVSPQAYIPLAGEAGSSGGRAGAIIFGTENDHMAAVTGSGELLWVSRHIGQFGRTSPTAGDLDGDGDYEVTFITSFNNPDSRLWALDANDGSLAWSAKLNLHGYVGNAIADIDNDGGNEVVLGIRSNTVYCFDGDGTKRWEVNTGGQAICWTPVIADINGDGRCEVVAGTRSGNEEGNAWFVISDAGALLGKYPLPGGCDGAPLVADLDGDGRVDIVLPGTSKGLLRCVTFGGKAENAPMPWVSSRHDAARLGCVPSAIPAQPSPIRGKGAPLGVTWDGPLLWGRNMLNVTWPGALPERLLVEVSTLDPLGRRTTRVQDLPREDLPASLPVDLAGTGKHTVTVRLWNPEDWSATLYAYKTHAKLGNVDALTSAMTRELDRLAAAADALVETAPACARLMRERRAQRLGTLDQLASRAARIDFEHAPNVDALLDEIAAFRAGVEQDAALAYAAEGANRQAPGRIMAVWEDPNPWDETPPLLERDALPEDAALDISMYAGEYESRCVTVLNLGADALTVQVRPSVETMAAVRFREVIDTPRRDGKWVPDALAPLGPAHAMRLTPGEARHLWLTIDGNALGTGRNELTFDLLAIDWREDRVPVTLRANVFGLDLRNAPLFRVCNWSSPSGIRGAGIGMEALHEARRHGMNVFSAGAPTPKCDGEGNLIGAVDWTAFDADLELMGPDGFLLIGGEGIAPPKGAERFSPLHVKAQRAWLHQLDSHLADKGWGRDRWALYPVDEPGLYGGTRIRLFEGVARHFREAMPEAPIYANPSGAVTRENMAGMVPLVDVWCPEQGLLRRDPDLARFFLDTGKPVWCYEAPPDVKTLHPLGYYRANSWMALRLGLSGTGFWTQFYEGAHFGGNDLWLQGQGTLFGANYTVAGHEVISRRWEAFRDGIEDVRAFLLLREAADAARAKGEHADAVARADALLGAGIEHATRKPWPCGDPTRFLRDYEVDFDEILRMRAEAAELTILLQGR